VQRTQQCDTTPKDKVLADRLGSETTQRLEERLARHLGRVSGHRVSCRPLDHEGKTSHGSSAQVRHSSRHSKAVLSRSSGSRSRGGRGILLNRTSSRSTVVVAGVSRDRASSRVGRVRVAALEADISSSSDLDEGVCRGGTDVGGLADGLAVGVDVYTGRCVDVWGQDGHEGAGPDDIGAADHVGDDGAVDVCAGAGDGDAGGAAVVSVAVCCCQGGEAEEEEIGDFELHFVGWLWVVWLIDDAREREGWLCVLESR
jgi:hypothetical protein